MVNWNNNKVIILGAGLTGLSAGWKLCSYGVPVEIIEAEDSVGGLARTIRYGDFLFDLGGHRFWTRDREIMAFVTSIMPDSLLYVQRRSEILFNGGFVRYPLELNDLLNKMGSKRVARYLKDYFIAKISKKPMASFKDYVKAKFGCALYDEFFGPYTNKFWGISPDEISCDWAEERIPTLRLRDFLGSLNLPQRSLIKNFYYPGRGIGEIARRISEDIIERGGRIHCSNRIKNIESRNGCIRSIYTDKMKMDGDFFISTIPITKLIPTIRNIDSKVRDACSNMSFRSIVLLNLIISGKGITDNQWIYVPDNYTLFHRIQEPLNWSSLTVPPYKTSLSLEIACQEGDEVYNLSERALFDRCVRDLRRIGFDIEDRIEQYFCIKVPDAYPIYRLGYNKFLNNVMAYLKGFSNLILCGRSGVFRYNNMDASIKMGFEAAESLLNNVPYRI